MAVKITTWRTGMAVAEVKATAWADSEALDGVTWAYGVAGGAATVTGATPPQATKMKCPLSQRPDAVPPSRPLPIAFVLHGHPFHGRATSGGWIILRLTCGGMAWKGVKRRRGMAFRPESRR